MNSLTSAQIPKSGATQLGARVYSVTEGLYGKLRSVSKRRGFAGRKEEKNSSIRAAGPAEHQADRLRLFAADRENCRHGYFVLDTEGGYPKPVVAAR